MQLGQILPYVDCRSQLHISAIVSVRRRGLAGSVGRRRRGDMRADGRRCRERAGSVRSHFASIGQRPVRVPLHLCACDAGHGLSGVDADAKDSGNHSWPAGRAARRMPTSSAPDVSGARLDVRSLDRRCRSDRFRSHVRRWRAGPAPATGSWSGADSGRLLRAAAGWLIAGRSAGVAAALAGRAAAHAFT